MTVYATQVIHSGEGRGANSCKNAQDLSTVLNAMDASLVKIATRTAAAAAADFSLTAADDGKIFYITAADKTATLPSVVDGLTFTFSVNTLGGSVGFSIAPAAADFIQLVNLTDNTAIINTAATDVIGDSITVVGDATLGGWIVTNAIGIWASA